MNRFGRVLLAVVIVLAAIPFEPLRSARAAGGACPTGGCNLYLPFTRNGGRVLKIGLVTDSGGINDRSFNQTAWQGVRDAEALLFVDGNYIEGTGPESYAADMETFLGYDYDLIVSVGFLMGDATRQVAQEHPASRFTIVDYNYDPALPNVIGQVYASEQAAFLSGYLAAGMTVTGKVATFGGMNIPPVTRFMNGFYQGVVYYNNQKGENIGILGWNPESQTGEFTNDFGSQAKGLAMGQKLLNQGADILFPVAGPTGFGAAEAVQNAGNAWVIGVDNDWTTYVPEYSDVTLTSVMKNVGKTTFAVIKMVKDNTFVGGNYTGTLENDGVGLGKIASAVPQQLIDEIGAVKAAIIAGTIPVTP